MKQLPSRVTTGNSHLQDHDYDPSYGKGTGKKMKMMPTFPHRTASYSITSQIVAYQFGESIKRLRIKRITANDPSQN